MKLGVIARGESRGLGHQTLDVCRNLNPERVLIPYIPGDKRFVTNFDWFDEWNTTRVAWEGGRLHRRTVRRWLAGLDVVYTAESVYDLDLPAWAAEARCGLAVQANPEMLSPSEAKLPVTWWSATPWRLERMPAGTRVVPMPAPIEPTTRAPRKRVRYLHVAGWPAVADRNGTEIVADAAALMRSDAEVVIRGQHEKVLALTGRSDRLTVEAGCPGRWDLYQDADVLVMPRRFGGLSLPAIEALTLGLPVVMSDCSPNEMWPGPRVAATCPEVVQTRAGPLPLHDTDPQALAGVLDDIATDPDLYEKLRREATEWAQANSWPALRGLWLNELQRACT